MPSLLHKQQILALLIDAQNAQCTLTPQILRRAACYGQLAVKRAYADWTRAETRRMRDMLQSHAVEPVQMFRTAAGKNAADITLSLDALDLLYTGHLDGFCIVSSDSDFTPLAIRLRRDGMRVYGFGNRHTPKSFVQACTKFIYLEDLELAVHS